MNLYMEMSGRVHPARFKTLKDRRGENITGAASKPSVNIRKAENGVLLQCDVQATSRNLTVEWKDSSGNILPAKEPQVTERGGSYDIILQAPVTKSDNYRCVVTQKEINHQIYTEIYVPLHGAASKPYITILDQTQDGMLLQCEVQDVSPKPKVELKDSSGKIIAAEEPQVTKRGGSYNITLKATVTKTDRYRCVVTQKEIQHETSAETYVPLNDNTVVIIIGAVITLVVVVGVAVVVLYKRKQKHKREEKQPEDPNESTKLREST